jgi:hypothetical protein
MRVYKYGNSEEGSATIQRDPEADRDRAAPPGCRSCGASLRWAKIPGPDAKRWFAICSCGLPAAYFPHRPDHEPDDPVSAALGPTKPSRRPPWIRVFQLTSSYP